MVATAELHSAADVAQRIIPAVAPLAMDPVEGVREQAISAITAFVKACPLVFVYAVLPVSVLPVCLAAGGVTKAESVRQPYDVAYYSLHDRQPCNRSPTHNMITSSSAVEIIQSIVRLWRILSHANWSSATSRATKIEASPVVCRPQVLSTNHSAMAATARQQAAAGGKVASEGTASYPACPVAVQ